MLVKSNRFKERKSRITKPFCSSWCAECNEESRASLFLPFAQVIASEEREENFSFCVLAMVAEYTREKRGLGFSSLVAEIWSGRILMRADFLRLFIA